MTLLPFRKCENCGMFRCPIVVGLPDIIVIGCRYDLDILKQIRDSTRDKSRPFEDVVKELKL